MSSHLLRLPYPPYLFRVLARTVLLWLFVKCLFLALFWNVDGVSAFLLPSYGIPAVLVWIDRKAARERMLPANLGAAETWLALSPLVVCFFLDGLALQVWG